MMRRHPRPTLFPYTTLFRSNINALVERARAGAGGRGARRLGAARRCGAAEGQSRVGVRAGTRPPGARRSEEHTSELQSRRDLVCRLLLEKKKKKVGPNFAAN